MNYISRACIVVYEGKHGDATNLQVWAGVKLLPIWISAMVTRLTIEALKYAGRLMIGLS